MSRYILNIPDDSILTMDEAKFIEKYYVKPGEWIQQYKNDGGWHDMGYFDNMYKCSNCGSNGTNRFNFCPNCGASMKKDGEAK